MLNNQQEKKFFDKTEKGRGLKRSDLALDYFAEGYNCAQSVLTAFQKRLELPESILLKAASGFGAGMGRLQESCGAVTGAYICFGLALKDAASANERQREAVYWAVQDFHRAFQVKMGATQCRELLNCDLTTAAGRQYYVNQNLYENVCQKCIVTAVTIAEEILASAENR
jgi:C_GCAxxG_C_C family probable redox protein